MLIQYQEWHDVTKETCESFAECSIELEDECLVVYLTRDSKTRRKMTIELGYNLTEDIKKLLLGE